MADEKLYPDTKELNEKRYVARKKSNEKRYPSNYSQGKRYLAASALLWLAAHFFPVDELAMRATEAAKKKPVSAVPLSKALNLEGKMGENADNVVRLVSPYGIGTGILLNPYKILTNHHVTAEAFTNKVPLYVTSPSYLAEGESIRVELTEMTYIFNKHTDRAVITLNKPIYAAHSLTIDSHYDFERGNRNIYATCYRDREVVTLRGEVLLPSLPELVTESGPMKGKIYGTTAQGGPGNSGCGVFNAYHDLVGTVAAVPNDKRYESTLDTGLIIFGDIGNAL